MNQIFNDKENFDERILEYQKNIEKEVALASPLVSIKCPLTSIYEEYKNDKVYLNKIETLSKKYGYMRKIRGDGNCFFRAFAFAHFENLSKDVKHSSLFIEKCRDFKKELVENGGAEYIIDDFYQTVVTSLDQILTSEDKENELETIFNDEPTSNYIIIFLRLVTSRYLQNNSDFLINFVEGYDNMATFCAQEVEVMNHESDHLHILALSSAFDVTVLIEYLNRTQKGNYNVDDQEIDGDTQTLPNGASHNFSDQSHHIFTPRESQSSDSVCPQIYLLYKPGHYDIIYP